MSSAAQVVANQQNAQKSTGPRTEAGKQRSALNSTRHGFTGQVIMLTAEEAEPYRRFNEKFMFDLAPLGATEEQLARTIIEGNWRINQLHSTESAIYALGHREYAEQFTDETPDTAAAMARAMTFENKRRELDRLHRYESRLQRQLAKDLEAFDKLQDLRRDYEQRRELNAVRLHLHFKKQGKQWDPAEFGFAWSNAEIEAIFDRRLTLSASENPRKAA